MYQHKDECFFDAVKRTYESTKPVVGAQTLLEEDIRPIAERRYKWNRIMKVDDNTYALLDGFYAGSPNNDVTTAMAPITVQRRDDGDYIRVRNGTHGSAWNSRYTFLMRYLPRGMDFQADFRQGKHFVYLRQTHETYPLPKGTFNYDYSSNTITYDGDEALWFKQTGADTFERAGHKLQVRTERIDKEAKKELKTEIKEFFNWMCTIGPMLDISYPAREQYLKELDYNSYRFYPARLDKDLVRNVLTNTESDKRVALAAVICAYLYFDHIKTERDLKQFRTKYNALMNAALGLYKTESI